MSTKRKVIDNGGDGASTKLKRGRTAANKSNGPIDLTSDSDDDDRHSANDTKLKQINNIANNNGSGNGSNGAAVAPVVAAASLPNGQSVNMETKKAVLAVAPVVAVAAVPVAVAAAVPAVAPVAVGAASSSSLSSSSSSAAARATAAPSPPLTSPVAAGTYKQSDAYIAASMNNQKGIKRLATEFSRLTAVKEYSVSLVDNDLFLWEIKIPFDATTTVGQDLATYYPNNPADRHVVIRMAFDTTHPFKAPFVRVRSPRFLKGSSNVMEGGAICMDTFSQIGWSPAMTAEKSILAIQSLLCTAGLNARLDPVLHAREYSEDEGKRSYAYVLAAHKEWDQTGSYNTGVAAMPHAAVLPPQRPPIAAAVRPKK